MQPPCTHTHTHTHTHIYIYIYIILDHTTKSIYIYILDHTTKSSVRSQSNHWIWGQLTIVLSDVCERNKQTRPVETYNSDSPRYTPERWNKQELITCQQQTRNKLEHNDYILTMGSRLPNVHYDSLFTKPLAPPTALLAGVQKCSRSFSTLWEL